VLIGIRQDGAATSAGFDWSLLYNTFKQHVLDEAGVPRDDRAWHTTAARPIDSTDEQLPATFMPHPLPSQRGAPACTIRRQFWS